MVTLIHTRAFILQYYLTWKTTLQLNLSIMIYHCELI